MADNEEHIDDVITSEIEAETTTSSKTKSSRKKSKKSDTSYEESEVKPVETTEKTKKTPKSKVTEAQSEMLVKIESRPQHQPPIRVPRVKKTSRKKAVKVNIKTINRVVRFF